MADHPILKTVVGFTVVFTSIFSVVGIIFALVFNLRFFKGKTNYTVSEKIKKILFTLLWFIPQISAIVIYNNL